MADPTITPDTAPAPGAEPAPSPPPAAKEPAKEPEIVYDPFTDSPQVLPIEVKPPKPHPAFKIGYLEFPSTEPKPPTPEKPFEEEYRPRTAPQLPPWNQITQDPLFQKTDSNNRLKVLDQYTEDLKFYGRQQAYANKEDSAPYDREVDDFNKTERSKIESPIDAIYNTGMTAARGAAQTATSIAVGLPRHALDIMAPSVDLSDIGKMTVDQAKNDLGMLTSPKYSRSQANLDKASAQAQAFLQKNYRIPGYFIQHPDEYFPGGPTGAINAIHSAKANQMRIDALQKYIATNGQSAPQQTATQEFMQITGELPEQVGNAIKVDEVYKRNHPIINNVANSLGSITPYILGSLLTGNFEAVPATAITEAVNVSDAFQTKYESAKAKLAEREAHGEYFTPYEKEHLALDDASRSAWGVGTFYAASNMILGSAMENQNVINFLKTEPGTTFRKNWLKFLVTGGVDTFAQAAMQNAANIYGNVQDVASGVDPNKKWYANWRTATLSGLEFGGIGNLFRLGSNLWGDYKVGRLADEVRSETDKLMNSNLGAGISKDQGLEMALGHVIDKNKAPHYADAVRGRIALDAAADEERQTAAKYKDIIPETGKALETDADKTQGTQVTPKDQAGTLKAQTDARIAERKRKRDEAVQQAATDQGGKEAGQPTPGTPTPPTPTTPTTPAPELSPEERAASNTRRVTINDQLNEYLGINATKEDKAGLVKDYLQRYVYQHGSNLVADQRRSAGQLMHDLELDVREKVPETWKQNTPQGVAGMEQHFSDFLARKIREKRETAEATLIPRDVLETAVANDDPTQLRALLQQKKQLPLSPEDIDKYDDFFYNHGFDFNFDKNKNATLVIGKEREAEPVIPPERKVEKATAEQMDVVLRQNTDEYANELAQLPEHPHEREYIDQALRILKGAGEARMRNQLNEAEHPDIEDIKGAALFSYLQALRRYADYKRKAGQENELVAPGEKLPEVIQPEAKEEKAPASEEEIEQERKAEIAEEKKPVTKLPNIWQHIRSTLRDYSRARGAEKTIKAEDIARLDRAPAGLEGETGPTLDNIIYAQLERAKERAGGTAAERELARIEEEGLAAKERVPGEAPQAYSNIGKQDILEAAKLFLPSLPEKDHRVLWYILRGVVPPDEIPEGVKGATNITNKDQRRVADLFAQFFKSHVDASRPEVEAPPGAGVVEPGAGEGGKPPPAGGIGVPPTPHAQPILPTPGVPGHEAGEPPTETGGREPGVREEGKTAPGQPQRVLPEETGRPGAGAGERPAAGGTTPGAEAERGTPGGERTEGAGGPGGATPASRERTGHVQERGKEEPGGPNPTEQQSIPGRGSAAGAPAGERVAGAGVDPIPLQVAKALLKKPEIAEDHGVELEGHATPQELAEHLSDLEADHDDPEAWYKEIASDLGIKLKEAAPPATVAAPKPHEVAHLVNEIAVHFRRNPEDAKRLGFEGATTPADVVRMAGAKDMGALHQTLTELSARIKEPVPEKTEAAAAPTEEAKPLPGEFQSVPYNGHNITRRGTSPFDVVTSDGTHHTFSTLEQAKAFIDHVGPKPTAPPVDLAKITAYNTDLTAKINQFLSANPDHGLRYGIAPGEDVLSKYRQLFQGSGKPPPTPEMENLYLNAFAQRLGIIDAPHPSNVGNRSGKVNSFAPGLPGNHGLTGEVEETVKMLRTSTDPEIQAFAKALVAHLNNLRGAYVYGLDHPSAVVFSDGKNLYISPAAENDPRHVKAVASELQHRVASQKLSRPQTPDEHDALAHWEYLRGRLLSRLPADVVASLKTHLGWVLDRYNADGTLDDRMLTPQEHDWMPIAYAANDNLQFLNAISSSSSFRNFLKGLKEPDGRSLWDGVQSWGNQIFGTQAFKFLDEVEPLTGSRPGLRLKDKATPLTEVEKHTQMLFDKYHLSDRPAEIFDAVTNNTSDPRLIALAQALKEVARKNPGISVGLMDRIGGTSAGSYMFLGDRVSVNPHFSERELQHSILHEFVHGYTVGKLAAFERGQVHLLSAADADAIGRLHDLRNYLLTRGEIPAEVRLINRLDKYKDRVSAFTDWANKDPNAHKYYGLMDISELCTESLTNGQFQDFLNSIPYNVKSGRPQTFLQKMFDWVREFLGFKPDTALDSAFQDVSRLMGGRRVMLSDITAGGLKVPKKFVPHENLMAKHYLDQRAMSEGYNDPRTVPVDLLNQWLDEWRGHKSIASGVSDPTKTYLPITKPDTRGQIQISNKLSQMRDPADILDHLTNVTGTLKNDFDGMEMMLRNAFRDHAISMEQFSNCMDALQAGSVQTFNKLHLGLGNPKDTESMISKWSHFWHQIRPRGELPVKAYEALQKNMVYETQATAFEIQNRWNDLRKALAQSFKVSPERGLPKDLIEDLNDMLEGGQASRRTMPANVIQAVDAMRTAIDRRSLDILDEGMVGENKVGKIEDNLGKYVARSYRLFDDPRFLERMASTPEGRAIRSAAEVEVNNMFKGGARAREARRVAENARADALRNYAPGSTDGIAAGQKAYDAKYADAMQNIGPYALDRMLNTWLQSARDRPQKNLQFGHAYAINDKLMTRLASLPPKVRELIGEERDPLARFGNTIWRQQNFMNSVRMAKDLVRLGDEGGYISKKMTDTNTTQIPTGFSHLGELRGHYTTPEIAGALTAYQENLEQIPNQNPFLRMIRNFESMGRYSTTILSPMRSMANFHGMFFSHLMNGYFNPVSAWKGSQDVFMGKLWGKTNPEREAILMDLYRRGLSDRESDVNAMMDFFKGGPHVMMRTPQDMADSFSTWLKRGEQLVPVAKLTKEKMYDLHTVPNFMNKASQYFQQIERQRAFNNEDVRMGRAEPMTEEQLQDAAAQIVKEENISYSRVSPFIREMRKVPIMGTFLTYWEQSLQSTAFSFGHMFKNLRSDNRIRRLDGIKRLAGIITSMSLPGLTAALSRQMNGISDSEDENFRKSLSPWEQNNAIVYGPLKDGKRMYWNNTYSTQQSDVIRAVHALLNFRNNTNGVPGAITSALYELFHSSFNLGLVPGALVDNLRNQTEYGTQVYNPEDTWYNQLGEMTGHVLSRVAGGGMGRFGSKILPAITHGGEYVTKGGAVRNLWTGVIPEITGFNINEISFPDRFRSELYSTKDNLKNAEALFTRPVRQTGQQLTDAQMEDLYQRSEQARQIVFNDLRGKIEAARFGGMTTRQIRNELHARQYSRQMIDDLMTNRYHPYIPPKSVIETAKENGNRIPGHLFSRRSIFLEPEESEEE